MLSTNWAQYPPIFVTNHSFLTTLNHIHSSATVFEHYGPYSTVTHLFSTPSTSFIAIDSCFYCQHPLSTVFNHQWSNAHFRALGRVFDSFHSFSIFLLTFDLSHSFPPIFNNLLPPPNPLASEPHHTLGRVLNYCRPFSSLYTCFEPILNLFSSFFDCF